MQRRRKLFPLAPGKKQLHNLNNACKITSGELEIIGKSRDLLRHKQIYISVIKGTLSLFKIICTQQDVDKTTQSVQKPYCKI